VSEDGVVTRQVLNLTRGAKLSAVAGLLLLIVAGFLFVVPLEKPTASGQPFRCGTAFSPASGDFAHSVCSGQVKKFRLATGAFTLGALVVALGAGSVFGVERRVERRVVGEPSHSQRAGGTVEARADDSS
jgi:hypothetical protein